jgi:predicted nucleotidyltransferase
MGVAQAIERQGHLEYQANPSSRYYESARIAAIVDLGLGDHLPEDALVTAIFVHGSVAADRQTSDSDLDVFVIGKADISRVRDSWDSISKMIGRRIDVTIMSAAQTRAAVAASDPFVVEALNGIRVDGAWP